MFAMEERTSIDCAREILGTASMARTVIPMEEKTSTSEECASGSTRQTSVAPAFTSASSASGGVSRQVTTSAPHACSFVTICAPA